MHLPDGMPLGFEEVVRMLRDAIQVNVRKENRAMPSWLLGVPTG